MSEDDDGKPDETGTLFVDILFALVVTQILSALLDPRKTTFLGGAHLTVAFALTILSWIGYHNSRSRVDARIRFPTFRWTDRRPLHPSNRWRYFGFFQFVLDVLMVGVYWMASITFERSAADKDFGRDLFWYWPSKPSAFPEALAVVLSFLLYILWDWIGRWESRDSLKLAAEKLSEALSKTWTDQRTRARAFDRVRKAEATVERRSARRSPTIVCFGVSLAVLLAAFHFRSGTAVFWLDVALIAILIAYRYSKEWVVTHLPEN